MEKINDSICPMCQRSFSQRCHLLRHIRVAHNSLWTCSNCKNTYNRQDNFNYHQRICVGPGPAAPVQAPVIHHRRRPTKSALNDTCQDFELDLSRQTQSPDNIFSLLKDSIDQQKDTLLSEQMNKKAVKFSFTLQLMFHQSSDETIQTDPPVSINSKSHDFYEADNIDELLDSTFEELQKRIETFEAKGSGWVLQKFLKLVLHIDHLVPLRASSYIPTPVYIANKKAVINVQNDDNLCFMWTYLSAIHPVDHSQHPERVGKYKQYQNEVNMNGIEMPMSLKNIPKFERQNNCSISIYGFEEKFHHDTENWERYVYPMKVARELKERHVDMLMISSGDKTHFVWIKNMSRLLAGQYTNHRWENNNYYGEI